MAPSTIPRSRRDLVEMVQTSFRKLAEELEDAGPRVAELECVDDWTVKDLLAVRAWWTESVVRWIDAGRDGESVDVPAPGYGWRETPRLNASIVEESRSESYESLLSRLKAGQRSVLETIDSLDDVELLQPGVFPWAGNYPLARWISLNTARQYRTARTFVRGALREAERDRIGL